jgi:tripeptide aminopeptidase
MDRLASIIAELPRYRAAAAGVREILLSHLTLIGETPAPTGGEEARMLCVLDRFAEAGLQVCSMDGMGNVTASRPGLSAGPGILLVAHADTAGASPTDQTIEIREDRVIGPFVGDNSIALAALATLPVLLDRLGLQLQNTLHFLAATRAVGRGNLAGLRQYLASQPPPVQAAVCLESFPLGRLNYSAMGMVRGEIVCRLPAAYDWAMFGATGTIIPMADVISRISRIPTPSRPLTVIIMGAIHGGLTHDNLARETALRFEARSESLDILRQLEQQIDDIAEDVAAQAGIQIKLEIVGRREPGGLDIGHPLVRVARAVLAGLELTPQMYPTTSMLAALTDAKIPAITLGITSGERRLDLDEIDESAAIEPMATGLAQLVGLLAALDGGLTP